MPASLESLTKSLDILIPESAGAGSSIDKGGTWSATGRMGLTTATLLLGSTLASAQGFLGQLGLLDTALSRQESAKPPEMDAFNSYPDRLAAATEILLPHPQEAW